MTAIRNYYTLGGSKQQNCLLFMVLEVNSPKSASLGQSPGVISPLFPLEAVGKGLVPSFSNWGCCCPWLTATSLQSLPSWSHYYLLSVSNLPLPSSDKNTVTVFGALLDNPGSSPSHDP